MKHILLLTILGFLQILPSRAQVCNEVEIILGDQTAVDQFHLNYPDCHEQINRLIIEGDGVTNLLGLSAISSCAELTIKNTPNLHSLEGLNSLHQVVNLFIENTGITNFNGLESLDTVGFLMHIYGNDQLKDLTGLDALKFVSALFITQCDSFNSLNGLLSLEYIKSLALDYNRSLVNMNGFPGVDEVDQIYIAYNENMTDLTGLESITYMKQDLQIGHNPNLTSLQGLHFLEDVRDVVIVDNPQLNSFSGFGTLKHVRGEVLIHDNPGLISLAGMNNLLNIEEGIEITGNNALERLEGLNALIAIGGHFQLDYNPQLTDITSLLSLRDIGGQLLISNNDQLTSLSGLDELASIGGLEITFNDLLQACSQESICNYLQAGGQAVIGGNAQGCANRDQVLEACLVGFEDLSFAAMPLYPNPAQTVIFLPEQVTNAVVLDATGRPYPTQVIGGKMEVSALPAGFYILRGEVDGKGKIASFVKM